METLLTMTKKIVPVDCVDCSHSKVCMYREQMKALTKELSDKGSDNNTNSPFKITLTCEYKMSNMITTKNVQEVVKPDITPTDVIERAITEIIKNPEEYGLEKKVQIESVAPMTSRSNPFDSGFNDMVMEAENEITTPTGEKKKPIITQRDLS